jgi:hypothetical protein
MKYVSKTIALKLKALGFKERVLTYFEDDTVKIYQFPTGWDFNTSFSNCVSRPTFSEVFDWFRQKYRLLISIEDFLDDYEAKIIEWTLTEDRLVHEFPQRTDISYPNNRFDTWEDAELACLYKLFELMTR